MRWLPTLALVFAAAASTPALAQSASVWSGVFTAEQAGRGKAAYEAHCAACHGGTLAGLEMAPALSGPAFMANWTGVSVGELADRIQTSMPADAPGSLSRRRVADLVAYLLSVGGFPTGAAELPSDPSLATQLIGPAP